MTIPILPPPTMHPAPPIPDPSPPHNHRPSSSASDRVLRIAAGSWLDAIVLMACAALWAFASWRGVELPPESKAILGVLAIGAAARWAAIRRNGSRILKS
jgi:hypothetical protein